jgi:hypothetical protein
MGTNVIVRTACERFRLYAVMSAAKKGWSCVSRVDLARDVTLTLGQILASMRQV